MVNHDTQGAAMIDQHRHASAGTAATPDNDARNLLRPVLWLLLILSAAANITMSVVGAYAIGSGFGLITVACAVALVVHHYRHRRA
ncbi:MULTISPECIES: hypothetical protein [Micromonospora]|uniref:hypothetical protein n=1 Tax=Micromonospora TaxID=1873 RepID=UPI001E54A76F|nr:hypothetical protein [Verrucosispora sp. ts21]